MRTKKLLLTMLLSLPLGGVGGDLAHASSSDDDREMLRRLTPTYLKNVTEVNNWGANWFVQGSAGGAAFYGKPIGCGDLFDRMKPAFQVGIGKWITPSMAVRVAVHGLEFKNCEMVSMKYRSLHADYMYNLTSNCSVNEKGLSRWDVIPYAGLGIINNCDNGNKPFTLNYGLLLRYRITDRLHVTAEGGGLTTFQNFDGQGPNKRFGDNLFHATVGLSVTIGKSGWKRIIDARPYIHQNDWLINYSDKLMKKNHDLDVRHHADMETIEQLQKILEIEGLLDKYHSQFESESKERKEQKRNSYSGLLALQKRLRNPGWDGQSPLEEDSIMSANATAEEKAEFQQYLNAMLSGKAYIGPAVYFFFCIGTDNLADPSQLVNLDEIARIAKKYDLAVRVEGSADSATGNEELNSVLGKARAKFIGQELIKRGLHARDITAVSRGGITEDTPAAAQRRTRVMLVRKVSND